MEYVVLLCAHVGRTLRNTLMVLLVHLGSTCRIIVGLSQCLIGITICGLESTPECQGKYLRGLCRILEYFPKYHRRYRKHLWYIGRVDRGQQGVYWPKSESTFQVTQLCLEISYIKLLGLSCRPLTLLSEGEVKLCLDQSVGLKVYCYQFKVV